MAEADDTVARGYDALYAAWGRSPTLRRIWRELVTGPDYPEDFAHISFLRPAQLRAVSAGLHVAEGQVLVDLACGAGGPGLWVARETGARLVGRDFSPVAIERARERAAALAMGALADYAPGSFAATGLASASADAVMTIDGLQYAPDKTEALREVARILRRGGRLAFMAFEFDVARSSGLPVWLDPVADYRPVLERTGFDVLSYEQIPNWRQDVEAGFGAVVGQREALAAELGEEAAAAMVLEASVTLDLQPYCGHALAIAERS